MQLLTLNSLLMFHIVFIFFLFLVGVTCLVYYLPPPALSSLRGTKAGAGSSTTSGVTTTCTGETVRFRRYSVGSLLSASDVAVGNHRFHNPIGGSSEEDQLVADCVLEEILSLRGSPVPSQVCACCVEQQQLLLGQHLVENPRDQTPLLATATAGVDYVQIEIERSAADLAPPCCYVRARDADIRECHGPIHDV